MAASASPALAVEGLCKEFRLRGGAARRILTAVDDVSFAVKSGQTVALVGESGSGKSTVARCITRLVEPTAGRVSLGDRVVTDLHPRDLRDVYDHLQMVFQDSTSSLDPRESVRATLDEPLRLHTSMTKSQRVERIQQLMADVELPAGLIDRLPRQLSGGQRQRLGIARALAVEPEVVVLDEPTSSLDVSVRGQIIDLLQRLQKERSIAFLFISHDLGVVRKIADRVLVMYLGAIIEEGPTEAVFTNPVHPYTRALLSAAPVAEYGLQRQRVKLRGEIPSPIDIAAGCRLVGRCPMATSECELHRPPLLPVVEDHRAACPVALGTRGPVAATHTSESAVG